MSKYESVVVDDETILNGKPLNKHKIKKLLKIWKKHKTCEIPPQITIFHTRVRIDDKGNIVDVEVIDDE